jgi:hypothetical protein
MILWHGQEVPVLPGLSYDDAAHKYAIKGRQVRGVTSYTGLLRDHSFCKQEDLDWGTCVHDHLYHHDMGTLDWGRLDPRIVPYIKAWQWVCESNGWRVDKMLAEYKLYSVKYWIAGRLDRAFETEKYDWFVDFKTGEPDAVTGIQLAGYVLMAIEHKLTTPARARMMEVCINMEGKPRTQIFDYKKELPFFIMQYSLRNRIDK